MSFRRAVAAAPAPVSAAFRLGKQALKGTHGAQVDCVDPRRFTGSIDLDAALAGVVPGAPRWDYGIGYREGNGQESAIWIEVHPATTGEVSAVLQKHRWLCNWLRTEAHELAAITKRQAGGKAFYWLATEAGVHIRQGSQQAFRLQAAGFDLPRRRIDLS